MPSGHQRPSVASRPRASGGQSSLSSTARMSAGAVTRWTVWLPSRTPITSRSSARSRSR
jgi:hypothetical protein